MATSTTTQAGPISASSTFGGVAFVSGNNVVVAHALTIDQATIIGSSPIGAPLAGPSLAKTTGGSLAAATWNIRYTHVDASGNESDLSPATTLVSDATNNRIVVTLPSLPTGVSSYNVYANPVNTFFDRQLTGATAGANNFDTSSTTTPYAPVYAIKVQNANGRLIINANLTIKGSLGLEGTTTATDVIVTQAAGTVVEFDGSAAPNTTFGYQVFLGGFTNGRRATYWKTNGTASSRCAVRSNAGGGNAYFVANSSETGSVDFNYTDFARIGTATTDFIAIAAGASTGVTNFTGCVLNACGRVLANTSMSVGYTSTVNLSTFKNTLHATECYRQGGATASPTGRREWIGTVSDKIVTLSLTGLSVGGTNAADTTIFLDLVTAASSSVRTPSALNNCLFRITGTSGMLRLGDWLECVAIADGNTINGTGGYSAKADLSNPHWTTISTESVTGVYAITSCIFESFGSDDTGDVDYGTAASISTAMSYCIAVPEDRDGGTFHGTGTMCTLNGAAGVAFTFNHNTWFVGGQGAIALAEAGNGFAGMLDEYQSNIVWNDAGHEAAYSSTSFSRHTYEPTRINSVSGTSMVANTVNATKCGHNCRFRLVAVSGIDSGLGAYTDGGVLGHSYHHYATTGTFGTTDVTGDPLFVDSSVRFWTWVKSIAGATLPGNATPDRKDYMAWGLYKLALKNEPANADFDGAYTLGAYKTFIRKGFTPQNSALKGTAHDGADIGAVTAVIPTTGSGKGYLTRWRRK